MRALVSRGLLVPPLVCAALVFGQAGTAAAVGDVGRDVPGLSVAESAARADAETERLLDSLTAEGTRLDPAGATSYAEELRAWSTTVQERLRAVEAPADRAVSTQAADPVDDLVAQVQSAVSGLLSSLTSLDLGGVLSTVTGLLSPVLDLVTGLLGGAVPTLPAPPAA
ncbi:hypothetical protein OG866_08390 [Streptomyces sp. NBC_00663]|uniref:hypothetical protein n=1 Tax=Streptomyces sp. NBC_00663 TaxID=2975801 RepID=UPI002E37A956|nr:hypothetical protein [Streptomyces sp. NBC_00663]